MLLYIASSGLSSWGIVPCADPRTRADSPIKLAKNGMRLIRRFIIVSPRQRIYEQPLQTRPSRRRAKLSGCCGAPRARRKNANLLLTGSRSSRKGNSFVSFGRLNLFAALSFLLPPVQNDCRRDDQRQPQPYLTQPVNAALVVVPYDVRERTSTRRQIIVVRDAINIVNIVGRNRLHPLQTNLGIKFYREIFIARQAISNVFALPFRDKPIILRLSADSRGPVYRPDNGRDADPAGIFPFLHRNSSSPKWSRLVSLKTAHDRLDDPRIFSACVDERFFCKGNVISAVISTRLRPFALKRQDDVSVVERFH